MPSDGIPSLSYNTANNRINSAGWEYDLAGNQTRGQNDAGVWLRFEHDEAGRKVKVKDDAGNTLESYTYGASRNRLVNETPTGRRYYAWGESSPIVEYTEPTASSSPTFAKCYVYAGSRLLSTTTNVSGTEVTEYHHPDRLGTKLVTNPSANTSYQQSTLPFGTALPAESTGFSNQVFTSYDRSAGTGLDYAVNRTHSPGQGRFTQADPIGMAAASIGNPQSNNLFAYVLNMPTDFVDPSGLYIAVFGGAMWDCYTVCATAGEITSCETTCTRIMSVGDGGGAPGGGPADTPGGGGGNGGAPGNGPTNEDTIPKDCEDLLKKLGILDAVKKILKDGPFIDVDEIANEYASNYIRDYQGIIKMSTWFFWNFGEKSAYTARGSNRVEGIYYRSSEFGKNLSKNPKLKLHEAVHLAFPPSLPEGDGDLDQLFAERIGLKPRRGETYSNAVSRFFRQDCSPKELQ